MPPPQAEQHTKALELRDYQQDCIRAIEDAITPVSLAVLPTGSGKSVILARLSQSKKNVLIVVPKVSLVKQVYGTLLKFHTPESLGVVCGSMNLREIDRSIVITTMQSSPALAHRTFDTLICDEAHRIDFQEPTSQYYSLFMRHLQANARIIGFTATPYRNGLYIYGPGRPFPTLTFSLPLSFAMAHGHIVRAITQEPLDQSKRIDLKGIHMKAGEWDLGQVSERVLQDPEKLKRQVLDAVEKSAQRNHILWVCVSVDHAKAVASLLQQLQESVVLIHSNSDDEIDDIDSSTRHIVSIMMFSEGVDIPRIDCVVLLRPTKSATLMVQIVGRALRPYPSKANALILDYGQVFRNCGPLDNPIVYQDFPTKRQTVGEYLETKGYRSWQCQDCGALVTILIKDDKICTECGHKDIAKIQDAQLMCSADVDATLYSEAPRWFPVIHIRIEPDSKKPKERKHIYLYTTQERAFYFAVDNPRFLYHAGGSTKRYYVAKALENKMEIFIREATGDKSFNIAHPAYHRWDVPEGFEVRVTTGKEPKHLAIETTGIPLFEGAQITRHHNFDKFHDWRYTLPKPHTVAEQMELL